MSSDAEREVQYGRRERATGRIAPLMGHPFADWWSESQQDWEHVQRDVGPWVPVSEWERSRPVSDAEVEAAAQVIASETGEWGLAAVVIARAALEAAAAVRAQIGDK